MTITDRARRLVRDGRERDGLDGIDPETVEDVLGLVVEVLDRLAIVARATDRGPAGPLTFAMAEDLIEALRNEAQQ